MSRASSAALLFDRPSETSKVTRQAITKHLEVLARAGLVHSARQGRERIWALDQISAQWGVVLERLRQFVEK